MSRFFYFIFCSIFTTTNSFVQPRYFKNPTVLKMNNPTWEYTSNLLKDKARKWFIKRAERKGIKWNEYLEKYKDPSVFSKLIEIKNELENTTIVYPNYFLRPFHGYDEGNMNWQASMEGEGATISMSVNYWQTTPENSETWLRGNFTNSIKNYINVEPKNIIDIGSSLGLGTAFIKDAFPKSKVTGLDLSPYFISTGKYLATLYDKDIDFIHANAEEIPLNDKTFDMITVQFLFHEVPTKPTQTILNELYRVLEPGGTIAIIDLDQERLKEGLNVNVFRKWAFEVTEPHIFEYYQANIISLLENSGFEMIQSNLNDPLNKVWLAKKPTC